MQRAHDGARVDQFGRIDARALHGMSRRELARRSGMSERYVAQIEAGKGNATEALAQALDDTDGVLKTFGAVLAIARLVQHLAEGGGVRRDVELGPVAGARHGRGRRAAPHRRRPPARAPARVP